MTGQARDDQSRFRTAHLYPLPERTPTKRKVLGSTSSLILTVCSCGSELFAAPRTLSREVFVSAPSRCLRSSDPVRFWLQLQVLDGGHVLGSGLCCVSCRLLWCTPRGADLNRTKMSSRPAEKGSTPTQKTVLQAGRLRAGLDRPPRKSPPMNLQQPSG